MEAAGPSSRRERGLAAAAVIIVLIVVAVALVLGRGYFQSGLVLDQRGVTDANLRLVSDALVQFASLNQRLPCPASGMVDTGAEDAAIPYATCNTPAGTVPWAALALRRTDALDGWGRKLSYRVYGGTTGLTQLGGASMVDCNTNVAATGSVDASGKCPVTHEASPAAFTAGKGLSVQSDSGTTSGLAFVLVSHGETGAGAFLAEGGGRVALPAAAALEYRNTQSGGTYDHRSRSAAGVATTNNAYFDDIVVSKSISELSGSARLAARDWGTPVVGSGAVFDAPTVAAVLGYTPDPLSNASTEQSALDFGTFAVAAVGSSAREVSYGQGVSGTGIGSIGASLTDNQYATINSQSDEGLYFVFDDPGRYLGITLVDFGTQSGDSERVRFWFLIGGSWTSVTRAACRTGNVLANFTLNPGGDFTDVYVESLDTASGATSSQFLVGAIRSCPDGFPGCTAPGAVSANNCPPP